MYGKEPAVISIWHGKPSEFQYIVYMPISTPESKMALPDNIKWAEPMIDLCLSAYPNWENKYIYISSKYMHVEGYSGNRPGWHSDGFLTEDINFIWSDCFPTEFCIQEFNLTDCHEKSLVEMDGQAKKENIKTYGEKYILKLNQSNIHRIPFCKPGLRAFLKLSISDKKYNLHGNAVNPLLDLDWKMKRRKKERNHPISAGQ